MMERKQAADPAYLRFQYGDTERLQTRVETHRQYSERTDDFQHWVVEQAALTAGQSVLDIGCGYGTYHPALAARGVGLIVGLDSSPAMIAAAHQQAMAQDLSLCAIRGDAQLLPFPDATFDRVFANHMLFHVPDQRAALREMQRVLKHDGRVVLAANAGDYGRRLKELHEHAARQLGYTPSATFGGQFGLDHLALVREVFPTAERRVLPNAFLFPTADAALRFYASDIVDWIEEKTSGEHRARLFKAVGARIEEIIAREGVFRVQKDAGCFVAGA